MRIVYHLEKKTAHLVECSYNLPFTSLMYVYLTELRRVPRTWKRNSAPLIACSFNLPFSSLLMYVYHI